MEMLITIGLVSVIAFAIWAVNKLLSFRICPICAGVSLTWLSIMAAILMNQLPIADYQLPVAILMGGTVVGIAYQGEKRFKWAASNILKFKVPVILVGFLLTYLALSFISWTAFWIEFAVLGLITYVYFVLPGTVKDAKDSAKIQEIEEKLKNCC